VTAISAQHTRTDQHLAEELLLSTKADRVLLYTYNNIEWMLQGVPYYWGNSTNHRTTSTTVPGDMF